MAAVLLAAEGSPWWVTVLTASVTGLLGLGAGASAAALVTTRHETTEALRTRMIEIGDKICNESMEARQLLQRSFILIEHPQHRDTAKAAEILDKLPELVVRIQQRATHLYLVFSAPDVGDLGSDVTNSLVSILNNLRPLLSAKPPYDTSAYRGWSDALEVQQKALLHALNREIRLAGRLAPFRWIGRRRSKPPRGAFRFYYVPPGASPEPSSAPPN